MEREDSILIRMPNWLGDFVMATPILTDLRKFFPNSHITAMCIDSLAPLLEKDRDINEVFSFSKGMGLFQRRRELRDLISKLREGRYDIGILLTNSFSSAFWFFEGRVKRRIGYRGNWRSLLLTDPLPYEKECHQIVFYKKLLEPLGIPLSDRAPRIILEEDEIAKAKEILYQRGYKKGKPLIGIHPSSHYGPAKCWPEEKFHEAAKELAKDYFVVFFGTDQEKQKIERIIKGLNVINFAGLTTIRELAALISTCSVFLANDSGPMHLASALHVPIVALFGSTSEEKTGPFQGEVISKKAPCSPCFQRICSKDFRCMKEIGVEEVLTKIKKYV